MNQFVFPKMVSQMIGKKDAYHIEVQFVFVEAEILIIL